MYYDFNEGDLDFCAEELAKLGLLQRCKKHLEWFFFNPDEECEYCLEESESD